MQKVFVQNGGAFTFETKLGQTSDFNILFQIVNKVIKTYLIFCKMTFQSNYMLLPPRNRLIQTLDILRCDGRPNCMNFKEQIVLVLDHTNASLKLSFDIQQNFFNNVNVRTVSWPAHCCYAISVNDVPAHCHPEIYTDRLENVELSPATNCRREFAGISVH